MTAKSCIRSLSADSMRAMVSPRRVPVSGMGMVLRAASANRRELAVLFSVQMGEFFSETGTSPADLRETLMSGRPRVSRIVLERAVARGEVAADKVTDRIAVLPYVLLQQEFLLTLKPVPTAVIEEIVDSIYLPLVLSK